MIDEDAPHSACGTGYCPSVTEICSHSMSCPSATEHGDGVIIVGTIAAGLAQDVRRADGRILSETIAPNETAVLIPSSLLSELPEVVRLREDLTREKKLHQQANAMRLQQMDRDDEIVVKLKGELAAQTRITEACHRSMKEMMEENEKLREALGCQADRIAKGDPVSREGALQSDLSAEAVVQQHRVRIDYINWRGEQGWRTIVPQKVFFGATEYHKTPQWLLSAYDVDKRANRDFAMLDIQAWTPLPQAHSLIEEPHSGDTDGAAGGEASLTHHMADMRGAFKDLDMPEPDDFLQKG